MLRRETGFTLVELVITIAILGVVVISLTNLFMSMRTIQSRTFRITSATHAAQREVESLRNSSYNSLTPGQDIDFTDQLPDDLPEPRSGIVKVSQPMPDIRRIDVTVSYTMSGAIRNITLSSLIGVIGISK